MKAFLIKQLKFYFFRWFRHVLSFLDSIIGFLTLGFYSPGWDLVGETWFLDASEN